MKPIVDIAVPLCTVLLLTAVGLDLTTADFGPVRRQPRILAIGLFTPALVLPLVALALVRTFAVPSAQAAGLLLVAVCPIGGISNTYSYLARATTALSVSLTGLSCLLAGITVPLLTRLFEAVLGWPLGFDAPLGVLMMQLVGMLGIPVGLGMAIRKRWPRFAGRHRGVIRRAAFGVLALLIVVVIWTQFNAFLGGLTSTVPLAATFITLSFAVGWVAATIGRASRRDRFTLAAEFATRNVAGATALAVTLLKRTDLAVFAVT
ncbi:MAG: bile acid:sodium symporter family protein [Bacteroidales bacterium]